MFAKCAVFLCIPILCVLAESIPGSPPLVRSVSAQAKSGRGINELIRRDYAGIDASLRFTDTAIQKFSNDASQASNPARGTQFVAAVVASFDITSGLQRATRNATSSPVLTAGQAQSLTSYLTNTIEVDVLNMAKIWVSSSTQQKFMSYRPLLKTVFGNIRSNFTAFNNTFVAKIPATPTSLRASATNIATKIRTDIQHMIDAYSSPQALVRSDTIAQPKHRRDIGQLVRRDYAGVNTSLRYVDASVRRFGNDAAQASNPATGSQLLAIAYASINITTGLQWATRNTTSSAALTAVQAQGLMSYLNSPIQTDVLNAVNIYINKKQNLASFRPSIRYLFNNLQNNFTAFENALYPKIPATPTSLRASATSIASKISADVQSAIAAYS